MRGDRLEAFEQLCKHEYSSVLRTAFLITGDREEAADLTQETFARAYERLSSVGDLDRPGAWLQRVVANLALSWRRRVKVRHKGRLRAAAPAVIAESELLMLSALQSLTPAQRTVIVLRYYADQPGGEVARILGKREGTIRALTSQGLARLREQMSMQEEADEARR